jgi:mitochondrial ornithine carrier protein
LLKTPKSRMAAVKDEIAHVPTVVESAPLGPSKKAQAQAQSIEALKDVVFGSTAGVLGKFIEYPFDTVKVRLQSQNSGNGHARLSGPLDAFAAAFRSREGPLVNLYRGISAPLVGAAVETSCLFFSYRIAQDAAVSFLPSLREMRDSSSEKLQLPFSVLLACGAASGAFTSLALTPIELVKCKMQVPTTFQGQNSRPPTIPKIIGNVFEAHGLMGFWHGQLGTLIRETGGSAAWFGSYEGVKMLYLKYDSSVHKIEDVKVWQQMTAGAVAGMLYNFAFYPADTIKSNMQTEEVGSAKKGTFIGVGRDIWKQSGVRGFYRGCGITVFRAAPSSAIIFSVMEALRKHFG